MVHTKIYKVDEGRIDHAVIDEAASVIRDGGLVVFPTETVYGVGCSASNKNAVRRLYRVKGRPGDRPLAFYVTSIADARRFCDKIPRSALDIMGKFWPGPITVLLPGADGGKIGLRCPANTVAVELLKRAAVPLAASSANKSGRQAAVTADAASEMFSGEVDIILDGGRTRYAGESTVVDFAGEPRIVREGVITSDQLFNYLDPNAA